MARSNGSVTTRQNRRTVGGDVAVQNDLEDRSVTGISTNNHAIGQRMDIIVGGNVTAMGNKNAVGILANNNLSDKKDSSVHILVNGTVTSDGTGVVVNSKSNGSAEDPLGNTIVTILDDVTAQGVGISVLNAKQAEILVDGTVSGTVFPISLNQNIDTDSLVLTVWAIEPDENGAVVARRGWDDETGERKYTEDEETEAQVQYIIRIEQPKKGGTLYAEGTTEYQGYDVAHEGETVYLKAELKPGFRIVRAFYDTDKSQEMKKEGRNVFSMVVPRGGAVLLSALLKNIKKQESVRPQNPVYTETAHFDKYLSVDRNEYSGPKATIKILANGGTINGKSSKTLLVAVGKTVVLPELDAREGFEFLGWYATKCNQNSKDWVEPATDAPLLPVNTEVKVMEKTVFTAIWKIIEDN